MTRVRNGSWVAAFGLVGACAVGCGSAPGAGGDTNAGETSSAVTVCAGSTTLLGLDVSEYQGTVNWSEVKSSGHSFAIARISDGSTFPDSTFATNWPAMKAAGLVRGAYQFFRASEDPTAQADLVATKVGTLGAGDLAPIADVEVLDGESGATLVAHLATWVAVVTAKTGRAPIIYSDPGFWNTLPSTAQFAGKTLWVADWGTSCPSTPTPWTSWALWQYSDTGSVSGVTGEVDLDRFNGTLAELQALAGGTSSTPSEPVDSGTPPPPATSTSCYSTTLALTVPANTCVETNASDTWVQCDNGAWVDRWDDPTACGATYPYDNGGHSSGGGTGCYSSTEGVTEPDNACVQSKSNNAWYQCDNGTWVDRWTDVTACNGVYAL
jgi:lysozyme